MFVKDLWKERRPHSHHPNQRLWMRYPAELNEDGSHSEHGYWFFLYMFCFNRSVSIYWIYKGEARHCGDLHHQWHKRFFHKRKSCIHLYEGNDQSFPWQEGTWIYVFPADDYIRSWSSQDQLCIPEYHSDWQFLSHCRNLKNLFLLGVNTIQPDIYRVRFRTCMDDW